jgi:hypothetical protein
MRESGDVRRLRSTEDRRSRYADGSHVVAASRGWKEMVSGMSPAGRQREERE